MKAVILIIFRLPIIDSCIMQENLKYFFIFNYYIE